MDNGGSFTSDDGTDEPDGHDDAPLRGWIPPDDRLWRHPSELASSSDSPVPATVRDGGRDRRAAIAVGSVGAAAVVVAVAAAFALSGSSTVTGAHSIAITVTSVTTPSVTTAPTGTSVGSSPAGGAAGPNIIAMVSALRPSIVGVVPSDPSSSAASAPAMLTGVVLPGGRLVVTAASAVVGMHGVDVVTSDGRHHAGVVTGADEHAGIAVVSVDDALTPATFSDDDVSLGEATVAACLCGEARSTGGAEAMPAMSVGMVSQTGESATLADGTDLIDTIEATMPLQPGSWGTVLLDHSGEVVGILDTEEQVAGETVGIFVPAPLAVGVADALAAGLDLVHGWLGIVCADSASAPGSGGPVVTSLFSNGPAAVAGIEPGDEIQALDGRRVATIAELQAALYTATPGTIVELTTVRGSSVRELSVKLASEPT